MYTFLLTLLILDSLILVAAILMQSAKGGGLAASFGGVSTAADSFMGTRQAGNFLTKLTWSTGGIFLFLSFLLQIMSTHTTGPRSVLDQGLSQTPATAPATTAPAPGVLPVVPQQKGGDTTAGQTKKP
jgi:preprotein translocase subunit SecG